MYLMNWNPESRQLDASFGGAVSRAEADVFLKDLRAVLNQEKLSDFEFVLDFAKMKSVDEAASHVFEFAREIAQIAGAKRVTFVTRDDDEVAGFTDSRLQQVLEGNERYVAYRLAA